MSDTTDQGGDRFAADLAAFDKAIGEAQAAGAIGTSIALKRARYAHQKQHNIAKESP